MRVIAKIEDCEIIVNDKDAESPATSRWKDQHERIIEMVHEAKLACIELHKQKISDKGK